jgi:carbonic anhydrase
MSVSTPSPATPSLSSDPLVAWQRLRAGNERYVPVGGHRDGDERPLAAVFRCADTTVPSELVFGQGRGTLIDVSTWGHVLDSGVIASLEYAVETRGVALIVVLGHHDCHAMGTAMRAWKEAVIPDGATRTVVEHAIGSIVRRGAAADSVEAVTSAHIVETGLSLLERSPVIARRVDAGRCAIVCATTSPTDGRIIAQATVGAVGEVEGDLLECV